MYGTVHNEVLQTHASLLLNMLASFHFQFYTHLKGRKGTGGFGTPRVAHRIPKFMLGWVARGQESVHFNMGKHLDIMREAMADIWEQKKQRKYLKTLESEKTETATAHAHGTCRKRKQRTKKKVRVRMCMAFGLSKISNMMSSPLAME